MKTMRKIGKLLLCIGMLIVLFAACGNDDGDGGESPKTQYEIPDVRGVYYSTAISMIENGLKNAGFKDYEVRYCWSWENYDPAMNACIMYTNPPAGTVIVDNGEHVFIELVAGEQAPVPKDKVLVVYFSVTHNTMKAAEAITEIEDADSYEIIPVEPYTAEDIDYRNLNCRALKEQADDSARPAIAGEKIDLSGYTRIYVGYPIWAGSEPRIIDTFVESYDFGDAYVIPFCTSGSSGIGTTGTRLAELAGSGNWQDGMRFPGNATLEEIKRLFQSMR